METLKNSTDVLTNVGLGQNQISTCADKGRHEVNQIKQIEQKDRLIVWSLFSVFVVVSVCIVIKRIYRLVKLGFKPVQIIGALGIKIVGKLSHK